MSSKEDVVIRQVRELAPGQSLTMSDRDLSFFIPGRMHNGIFFSPEDRVLESIVGASYQYGYRPNPTQRTVTFFRLSDPIDIDGVYSYVSPDQRHHFRFEGNLFYHWSVPV